MQSTKVLTEQPIAKSAQNPSGELTIHLQSSYDHPSAMPEEIKMKKQADAPALHELFCQTIEEKCGEANTKTYWIAPDEVEVEGLSNIALHSFILKAEELGKTVHYTKTLTVKISD